MITLTAAADSLDIPEEKLKQILLSQLDYTDELIKNGIDPDDIDSIRVSLPKKTAQKPENSMVVHTDAPVENSGGWIFAESPEETAMRQGIQEAEKLFAYYNTGYLNRLNELKEGKVKPQSQPSAAALYKKLMQKS